MYYKDFLSINNEFKFNTDDISRITTDYIIYYNNGDLHLMTENRDLFNCLSLRLQKSTDYILWWDDYEHAPSRYTQSFKLKDSYITMAITFREI